MWNAANRAADSLPRPTGCSMPGYGRTIRPACSARQIRKFTDSRLPCLSRWRTIWVVPVVRQKRSPADGARTPGSSREAEEDDVLSSKADLRGRHGEREQDCCGHFDGI